mgnify:CR=1 FL=1
MPKTKQLGVFADRRESLGGGCRKRKNVRTKIQEHFLEILQGMVNCQNTDNPSEHRL